MSECEHADGYPLFTGLREKRRARKDHRCGECGSTITKGTEYIYRCGKWQPYDGLAYFWDAKTCLRCDEDWSELSKALHQAGESLCCIQYGELRNRIGEALDLGWLEDDHPLVKKWLEEVDLTLPSHVQLEACGQLPLAL